MDGLWWDRAFRVLCVQRETGGSGSKASSYSTLSDRSDDTAFLPPAPEPHKHTYMNSAVETQRPRRRELLTAVWDPAVGGTVRAGLLHAVRASSVERKRCS